MGCFVDFPTLVLAGVKALPFGIGTHHRRLVYRHEINLAFT